MSRDELEKRIEALSRWCYGFTKEEIKEMVLKKVAKRC